MSVTDSVSYRPLPQAIKANSYKATNKPISGSEFSPGGTIRIDIPVTSNAVLNGQQSYLKFRLRNKNGVVNQALALDGHASSLIAKLEVWSSQGGNLLESIENYNRLYSLLMDVQMGSAQSQTGQSAVAEGCDVHASNNVVLRGHNLDSAATTTTKEFCIPLLSTLVGSLQKRYFPIGLLNSPLRLEITLADAAEGCVAEVAGQTDWDVDSVSYETEMIQTDAETFNAVAQAGASGDGLLRVPCESYRHYQAVVENGASNVSTLLPMKFKSLKTILCMFQKVTVATDDDGYSVSQRDRADYSSHQFRIGSRMVPAVKVSGIEQAMTEVNRAFHQLGDISVSSRINYTNYNSTDVGAAAEGKFLIAQELESFANADDRLSGLGIDSRAETIFFEPTLDTAPAQMNLHSWGHYDCDAEVDPASGEVRMVF